MIKTLITAFVLLAGCCTVFCAEVATPPKEQLFAIISTPSTITQQQPHAITIGVHLAGINVPKMPTKVTFHTSAGSFSPDGKKEKSVDASSYSASSVLSIKPEEMTHVNSLKVWVTFEDRILAQTEINIKQHRKNSIHILHKPDTLFAGGQQSEAIAACIMDEGGVPLSNMPAILYLTDPNGTLTAIAGCTDNAGVVNFILPTCNKIGRGSFEIISGDAVSKQEYLNYVSQGFDADNFSVSIAAPVSVILSKERVVPILVAKTGAIPGKIVLKATFGKFNESGERVQQLTFQDGLAHAYLSLEDFPTDRSNILLIAYMDIEIGGTIREVPIASSSISTRIETELTLSSIEYDAPEDVNYSGKITVTMRDSIGAIPANDVTVAAVCRIPGIRNGLLHSKSDAQGNATFYIPRGAEGGLGLFQASTLNSVSSMLFLEFDEHGKLVGVANKRNPDGTLNYISTVKNLSVGL